MEAYGLSSCPELPFNYGMSTTNTILYQSGPYWNSANSIPYTSWTPCCVTGTPVSCYNNNGLGPSCYYAATVSSGSVNLVWSPF